MASAYSILRTYTDFVPPADINLLARGLQYKQGRYDANWEKTQSLINQYANIQLAKQEDTDYLSTRLNALVSNVNQIASGSDLSSTALSAGIQNHIGQVLDKNVLNAIAGTKRYNDLRAQINDIKTNKPKQYAAQNEAYAMKEAYAWLSDGQAGTPYAGGDYIPYTDTLGEQQKALRDLYKDSESVVEFRDGRGGIVKKKFKGMKPDEIEGIFNASLTAQDMKQLEIDTWATYGQNPQRTQEIFNNYATSRRAEIAKQLQNARNQNKTEDIQFYDQLLTKFDNDIEKVTNGEVDAGLFLHKDGMVGGLKNTFRERQVSMEYKSDVAFWESRRDSRATIANQIAQKRYNLEVDKFNFSKEKFEHKQKMDFIKAGLTSTGAATSEGGSISLTQATPDQRRDDVAEYLMMQNTATRNLKQQSKNLRSTLLADYNDEITNDIQELKAQNKWMKDEDVEATVLQKYLMKNKVVGKGKDDFMQTFNNYKRTIDDQNAFHNQTKELATEGLTATLDNVLFSEGNKSLRDAYGISEFKGVTDNTRIESLSDIPEAERTPIIKQMLADIIRVKSTGPFGSDKNQIGYYVDMYKSLSPNFKPNEKVTGGQLLGFDSSGNPVTRSIKIVSDDIGAILENNPARSESVADLTEMRRWVNGTEIDRIQKQLVTPDVMANVGTPVKVYTAEGKNVGRGQKAMHEALTHAKANSATLIRTPGGDKPLREHIDLLEDIKHTKNDQVSVTYDSGVPNMALVEYSNGVQVLMPEKIVTDSELRHGIKTNIASKQNNRRSFISDDIKTKVPITYMDDATLKKNFSYLNSELSEITVFQEPGTNKVFTAFDVATPTSTQRVLSKRFPQLTPEQHKDIQDILRVVANDQIPLTTDIGLVKDVYEFNIESPKIGNLYSFAKPWNTMHTTRDAAEQASRIEDRAVTVSPSYAMYKMLEAVITEELKEEYPDHTIKSIKEKILNAASPQ